MSEIKFTSEQFDKLLADLEPKPCPKCEGEGRWMGTWGNQVVCDKCDDSGTVPGVAVIPLEEEPTEDVVCRQCGEEGYNEDGTPCESCSVDGFQRGIGYQRVRADRLTIREADAREWTDEVDDTPITVESISRVMRPRREVSVRVIGWADGQMTVEKEQA